MQGKQLEKKKLGRGFWVTLLVMIVLIPLTVGISWYMGDRKYYIASVLIMIYSMLPFFAGFESRKPQARELVTLAVMCAIAVASRAAFIWAPNFKPIGGIVMITAMAFGPQAGFMTGSLSLIVSDMIFGQGPWTPWQMFAYGMAGFIAGLLSRKGIITPEKRIFVTVFGGLVIMIITGPLLDTCTLFTMSSTINISSALMVYSAGVPFNGVLAASTMATLFILCRPMTEKLDRIKTKYGMMNEDGFI